MNDSNDNRWMNWRPIDILNSNQLNFATNVAVIALKTDGLIGRENWAILVIVGIRFAIKCKIRLHNIDGYINDINDFNDMWNARHLNALMAFV